MPEALLARYAFTNLTPLEGSDVNDAADANEFNANWLDISVALGVTRFRGSDCLDKASGAAVAEFWLRTQSAQNKEGAITAGYFVLVCDDVAGDYWEDDVLVQGGTGPYLRITDADYKGDNGALPGCTGAYTTAWQDWDIYCFPMEWKLSKGWLIFNNLSPGAVTGDDISVGVATATKIGTYVTALKARVDVALDGAGALNSNVVTNLSLDKDEVFLTCVPESLSEGGDAELFLYDTDLAYGLEETTAAATGGYARETTTFHRGFQSQRFTTSATPEGVLINFKRSIRPIDYIGQDLTVQAWVNLPVSKAVLIGFVKNGPVVNTSSFAPNVGTWFFIWHTWEIPAGTTTLSGTVTSGTGDAGVVHYLDDWAIYPGNCVWEWAASEQLSTVNQHYDQDFSKNYVPFSDFSWMGPPALGVGLGPTHAWMYGSSALPVFWNETQVALSVTAARNVTAGKFHFGNASLELTIPPGESIYHLVGLRDDAPTNPCVNELQGMPCTFSVYLLATGANPGVLALTIKSGTAGPVTQTTATKNFSLVTIGDTNFWWASVTEDEIHPTAEWVEISIGNTAGEPADVECIIDAVQVTRTQFPMSYRSTTNWRYIEESFAVDTDTHSVLAESVWYMGYGPMPPNITTPRGPNTNLMITWYGLSVYVEEVPIPFVVAATDTFELTGVYWDTVGTAWTELIFVTTTVSDVTSLGAGTTDYKVNGVTRAGGFGNTANRYTERLCVKWTAATTTGDLPSTFPVATAHGLVWGP